MNTFQMYVSLEVCAFSLISCVACWFGNHMNDMLSENVNERNEEKWWKEFSIPGEFSLENNTTD